jgi:hypothetical protein
MAIRPSHLFVSGGSFSIFRQSGINGRSIQTVRETPHEKL